MSEGLFDLWTYLAAEPLLGLTLTLAAFVVGDWIYRRSALNPLFNPVLIAIVLIVGVLFATKTDYEAYFDGAQFIHSLLGPATVALAVPLYRNYRLVRRSLPQILVAVLFGSVFASASAVGLAWVAGASQTTLLSLAPKSTTTPVAMGITEQLGGLPSLTAVLVILTGIVGATLGAFVLDALQIKDWRARGFAIGLASHGIGTARALSVNETAGAFASLAMGLNALATAVLVPLLFGLLV
ncbi:MAG: LrgB family protein [Pseudomonadota bacterium]